MLLMCELLIAKGFDRIGATQSKTLGLFLRRRATNSALMCVPLVYIGYHR